MKAVKFQVVHLQVLECFFNSKDAKILGLSSIEWERADVSQLLLAMSFHLWNRLEMWNVSGVTLKDVDEKSKSMKSCTNRTRKMHFKGTPVRKSLFCYLINEWQFVYRIFSIHYLHRIFLCLIFKSTMEFKLIKIGIKWKNYKRQNQMLLPVCQYLQNYFSIFTVFAICTSLWNQWKCTK